MNKPLYYLATAYNDASILKRNERYRAALMLTIKLIDKGFHIFSPIVHNHEVAVRMKTAERGAFDFWREYDCNFLSRCNVLLVYADAEGLWQQSVGVNAEMKFATDNKIQIMYLTVLNDDYTFQMSRNAPR
jgi:hypothetical protein